ncbi:NADH-quinone oxidoreductase subunit N [Vallicoccus soli]|uniref:NADH-quinone oxidoreductase subunit N n=1 Tax=Vallicoccus soli TaxID=2339232 RepID=A0A3A3YS10_9ACTN|nr:proton-conducting transporter membrane subunit [Vallicoccus soli]RJK93426.1 NADH-quinone oxidoreductase subunit N [Vallicoccus soli]
MLPQTAQSVDWALVGAPLAAAVAAVVVLVADLLLGPARRGALGWLALAGLAVAGALLVPLAGERRGTFCLPGPPAQSCSYVVDALTLPFQAVTVAAAAVVVLLALPVVPAERLPAGEHWFLLLSSVSGALVLAAARDLMTLVVALEVVTLPTYALVALRRHDGRSSEAALKLFLVSVVSVATMLYGVALVYGATGQVLLDRVAAALADPATAAGPAQLGVLLTLAGLAFKVAAVPFHWWAPDTYVGAPLPVTAFLSVVSKLAGFVGLLVVLSVGFPAYADRWAPALAVLAVLTMSVGNLVALRQRHAVRLLAWSSVAQSGYVLLPLGTAADDLGRAVAASAAYALAYAVMNLLALAAVVAAGPDAPGQWVASYRGLWSRRPLVAGALALALVSLAGLPPGLLGLFAKLVVLEAPVAAGAPWLAAAVAVNVVVGLAYYLAWGARLVARPDGPSPARPRPLPRAHAVALGAALAAVLVLGFVPGPVLDAVGAVAAP